MVGFGNIGSAPRPDAPRAGRARPRRGEEPDPAGGRLRGRAHPLRSRSSRDLAPASTWSSPPSPPRSSTGGPGAAAHAGAWSSTSPRRRTTRTWSLAAELGPSRRVGSGTGRRAPITVGRSQWIGLRRFIDEIERARRDRTRYRPQGDRVRWRSPTSAIVGAGSRRPDGRARADPSGRSAGGPRARPPTCCRAAPPGSAGLLSPAHCTPLATPGAVREGLRHMLRQDSPFCMRPRPRSSPGWCGSCSRRGRAGPDRGTELIRDFSFASLELHQRLADGGSRHRAASARGDQRLRDRRRLTPRGSREAEDPRRCTASSPR